MSPSLRGRGLKIADKGVHTYVIVVALFTRAWIEILKRIITLLASTVALFTRAWIEIQTEMEALDAVPCRPLYEGVD